MKQPYSRIAIIYNPNSTSGKAGRHAKRLHRKLTVNGLQNVELVQTEYARHAETIAYDIARTEHSPLIISVSGDGGYHEVINGALQAQDEDPKRRPVCAILAAGNANDHRRTIRRQPLARAILNDKPEAMDILKLSIVKSGKLTTRYAHSYIGFGLTGQVADRLNRTQLNRWRELLIVLRTLFRFHEVRTRYKDGTEHAYDSLVCAKLHQMSKIYKMGKRTNLQNGLFRIVAIPHSNRLRFLIRVIGITIFGFKRPPQVSELEFKLLNDQYAHGDGEVFQVKAGVDIRVSCEQQKLLTLR